MPGNTILVVEDDPMLRLDAVTLFRDAGLDVVEFNNADDALAFAWAEHAHVTAIFSDIQMPGDLDGLGLAEIVSRHWPHIIVMLTSGAVKPIEPLSSNIRFMPKPWLPTQVLLTMREAIEA